MTSATGLMDDRADPPPDARTTSEVHDDDRNQTSIQASSSERRRFPHISSNQRHGGMVNAVQEERHRSLLLLERKYTTYNKHVSNRIPYDFSQSGRRQHEHSNPGGANSMMLSRQRTTGDASDDAEQAFFSKTAFNVLMSETHQRRREARNTEAYYFPYIVEAILTAGAGTLTNDLAELVAWRVMTVRQSSHHR